MSPKILLTGRNGQVGAELEAILPLLGEVVAFERRQLDLAESEQIRRAIREVHPQYIVNAAAYTDVDRAESDETTAYAINAIAPAIIAEEAMKIGAFLVHYSTDYVFDGSKNAPYEETDLPNPQTVYGRTKLAGEQAIRNTGVSHLIFRTAWVYGTRRSNFLLTILRLASQREKLRIVSDQIGAPTWCREISRATTTILKRISEKSDRAASLSQLSGTYHMTAAGTASWCDFAQAIMEETSQSPLCHSWSDSGIRGRPPIAHRVTPITTADYPTPARRPAYSVLSNALLTQTFGVQLPDWRVQLHSAISDSRL